MKLRFGQQSLPVATGLGRNKDAFHGVILPYSVRSAHDRALAAILVRDEGGYLEFIET